MLAEVYGKVEIKKTQVHEWYTWFCASINNNPLCR
jgi:hypothetical protein